MRITSSIPDYTPFGSGKVVVSDEKLWDIVSSDGGSTQRALSREIPKIELISIVLRDFWSLCFSKWQGHHLLLYHYPLFVGKSSLFGLLLNVKMGRIVIYPN